MSEVVENIRQELLKRCNDVSYLDREADMIPEDLEKLGVRVYNEDVETFVNHSQEKYNKVFCEQAINYWLLNINIESMKTMSKTDKNVYEVNKKII